MQRLAVWFAVLQVVLAALLVTGGLRVLARDRRWLLGAGAAQLLLCGYWFVVLADLSPATLQSTVLVLPVLYLLPAALSLGLVLLPDARAWTVRPAAPTGG